MTRETWQDLLMGVGDRIGALSGWRRGAFAFAAGAVSATGFAPLQFFPALLLGYAALVLLIDLAAAGPRPVRQAMLLGWCFAFGQYLIGLHWIGYAFMVDPSAHLWQMPFALLLLAAGLGLFGALSAGVAARFWSNGASRLLVFAVAVSGSEWLRGHVLTGFPWNLPAYGWGASLAILQSAALFGAYGLSLLTVLLGASLADLFSRPRRASAPLSMISLFAAMWVVGTVCQAITPESDVPGVRLRLVQPDIPQAEKYARPLLMRNWRRLVDLSAGPGNPNVIIWPEAAPPFPLERVPQAVAQIGRLTGRDGILLTGSERVVAMPDGHAFYNSLYIYGRGSLLGTYDKFHLVPFGEYVPFAALLNHIGVTKLTAGEAGFTPGDGPRAYDLPGFPRVTPLICYEVIFPGAVTAPGRRPGWLVNVTDDSWFGPWAGPRQHLLIARVRAIEDALPIVRVANTGISAVIDPIGRLRKSLPLGDAGVVDAGLPAALAPSLYARLGDLLFLGLMLLAAGVARLLARR